VVAAEVDEGQKKRNEFDKLHLDEEDLKKLVDLDVDSPPSFCGSLLSLVFSARKKGKIYKKMKVTV